MHQPNQNLSGHIHHLTLPLHPFRPPFHCTPPCHSSMSTLIHSICSICPIHSKRPLCCICPLCIHASTDHTCILIHMWWFPGPQRRVCPFVGSTQWPQRGDTHITHVLERLLESTPCVPAVRCTSPNTLETSPHVTLPTPSPVVFQRIPMHSDMACRHRW